MRREKNARREAAERPAKKYGRPWLNFIVASGLRGAAEQVQSINFAGQLFVRWPTSFLRLVRLCA
jgi:hypothetical protein